MAENDLRVSDMPDSAASVLLKEMLYQLFGVDTFVLFVVGPNCEHGHSHVEMYSRGMTGEKVRALLVESTAAIVADAL